MNDQLPDLPPDLPPDFEESPSPKWIERKNAAARLRAFERKTRDAYLDGCNARDKSRTCNFHIDGSVFTVSKEPGYDEHENERTAKRGRITGFSAKSRARFLGFVSTLRRDVLPLFITLTYPGDWPQEFKDWKDQLNKWFKNRVARKWPQASMVWKLEPQERGAPHFHLIVWGIPFMPAAWLARSWFEIVGSQDFRHLQAGTSVERARSFRGVMCYSGKKYMGKQVDLPAGWEFVGRFWGVMGRKVLPRSRVFTMTFDVRTHRRLRRLIRKAMIAKGKAWKTYGAGRGPITFFTQEHLQWARAIDWCETGTCQAVDFSCPLIAQPF